MEKIAHAGRSFWDAWVSIWYLLICGAVTVGPLNSIARAAETDQFTGRFEELARLPDQLARMDGWVEDRLNRASSRIRPKMNEDERVEVVARELLGSVLPELISTAEMWLVTRQGEISKFRPRNDGIFFDTPLIDARMTRVVGLASTLRLGGVLIGEDKIGHFFSQGYDYYKLYRSLPGGMSEERKLEALRKLGDDQEIGPYGLAVDGVYSFADLAANWAGFEFYRSLFGGNAPFFRLDEDSGRWVRNRRFTFFAYVTDDWDEVLNPSQYINERLASRIQRNVDRYCNQLADRGILTADPQGSGRRMAASYRPERDPGKPTVRFRCLPPTRLSENLPARMARESVGKFLNRMY